MSGRARGLLALGAVCGTVLAGCARSHDVIRIVETRNGGSSRLTLVADPGVRINARLKPALELSDGRVIRFDSPSLTPDSNYFIGAPAAEVRGKINDAGGHLRASVCARGDSVCRTVRIER
ncbi:MAG: hypothetical protein ABJD11_01540 [Gemmatimonadota bacterium]